MRPRSPQAEAPRARVERAEKAERPERPRYDITCAECGIAAQVPFKPLEGRQVFCQPCYKARKAPAATPTAEGDASSEADNGIVE
jgi:CxxC-x17-CxxC domain-containing protein